MCRARARCEADLGNLQLPANVKPGQLLVIKQLAGVQREKLRFMAQHEEVVLKSLRHKEYAPECYGLYESLEAGGGDVPYCGSLVVG